MMAMAVFFYKDDDDVELSYSHYDKLPPWWEYSNGHGGILSPAYFHHWWWILKDDNGGYDCDDDDRQGY